MWVKFSPLTSGVNALKPRIYTYLLNIKAGIAIYFYLLAASLSIIIIPVFLLFSCASKSGGTGYSLQEAIEQSAQKTADILPKGSRVAIVAFNSVSDTLSDYIMEELTGALFDRGIEVADRQNLVYVYKELNFQMSGDVSDESAKSIGKFLAADMVITGDLIDLDNLFRYRTNAINVETAVRSSVTRFDVRSDIEIRRTIENIINQHTITKISKYGVSEEKIPKTSGAFLDRGILFLYQGKFEKAITDFSEAIRLNPNMSAAFHHRGMALVASISDGEITSKEGNSVSWTSKEASMDQARQIFIQAISDFSQAIKIDPNDARAYNSMGNVYGTTGNYDKAINYFNQAIKINKNYDSAYIGLGGVYYLMGDYDQAITYITKAILLNPNNKTNFQNRGNVYLQKKDYDNAILDYNQVIQIDPNDIDAYNYRGNAYFLKGNYDQAIINFSQAIQLDPTKFTSYYNRATMYFYNGDYDLALSDYSQAIQINRNYANAYINRGNIYMIKHDYNRAIDDFEIALALNPGNANIKQNLDKAKSQRDKKENL